MTRLRVPALIKSAIQWLTLSVVAPLLRCARIRFLPVAVWRIGHLACEPDCYVKERLLGLRPWFFTIVRAPAGKIANRHLLRYWHRYLWIVTSPRLCRLTARLSESEALRIDATRYAGVVNNSAAAFAIQARYGERPPLLTLRSSDRERGWTCLDSLGMPRDAWFVCVHCREAAYDGESLHNFRNARIADYLSAIEAITTRGGWCIRMGDPTMVPLPPMEHVIDYAHSGVRSDWMDVFLCASCRFFLGGGSGLYNVANVFGVPAAVANQAPMSVVQPYGFQDIGIPKLLWSLDERRFLTFEEILSSPLGNARYTHLYEGARVEVIDNTPKDIRALALEMLDVVEGRATYTTTDERVQARFKSLMKPGHYSYGTCARVGRDFLRQHAELLADAPTSEAERSRGA